MKIIRSFNGIMIIVNDSEDDSKQRLSNKDFSVFL